MCTFMRFEVFRCGANCGLLGLVGAFINVFEDSTTLNFEASSNPKKSGNGTLDVVTTFRLHGIMIQKATI